MWAISDEFLRVFILKFRKGQYLCAQSSIDWLRKLILIAVSVRVFKHRDCSYNTGHYRLEATM